MALIRRDSGCKVGWETYDNEDEARARAESLVAERNRMLEQGYDFGYQWPGEVRRGIKSRYRDGEFDSSIPIEYIDEWTVTVP